jgi:hypothetical protein
MASQVSGTTSRRALGSLCALALVVSLVAAFAGRASATTTPGFVLTQQVTITDSQIRLVPHAGGGKYVNEDGHSARFPRGIRIHFLFTNKGTQTYLPVIRFTDIRNRNPYAPKPKPVAASPVAPGRHTSLWGNFSFRGAFVIEKRLHKKLQGKPIVVTVY